MNIKNLKNYKTYEKLLNKEKDKGRMPSLSKVSELLNEVGIENSLSKHYEYKLTKSTGNRYYSGGGNKEYTGYKLTVPSIHLNIDSTETYYSYNTWQYAGKILDLINLNLIK